MLAGKKADPKQFINIPRLISAYYTVHPDPNNQAQRVSFGTSGHRGVSFEGGFNEDHILAITQAICDYRKTHDITGPLFLGMDTHALSEPAHATTIEVLTANRVEVMVHKGLGYTPTPVISHAILGYNRDKKHGFCDGVVITPSHNPPAFGGFKYNPSHGGPAGTDSTQWIAEKANTILENRLNGVSRMPYARAICSEYYHEYDYITPYVSDLKNIINMDIIRSHGLRIGADAMGGSGLGFWEVIAETYGLDIDILNHRPDPNFSFMHCDFDGKIRMDCSSPYAMAGLIDLRDRYSIAFGNDPDFDRHGIVTPHGGLMRPNPFLCVAIDYLFSHRDAWRKDARIGKTLVSSAMIDRVAARLKRDIAEVPVGFKWFVDGLLDGSYGFGGEESAGASFLRINGQVWSTDKDGIIMDLLACEIMASTNRDPAELYEEIEQAFGHCLYERIDAPADTQQRDRLKHLSPDMIIASDLAGEKIVSKLTRAPGNNAPIGGLKVTTKNGWFAARPSGTEDIYKIYAESFKGEQHLKKIQEEAETIITRAFQA